MSLTLNLTLTLTLIVRRELSELLDGVEEAVVIGVNP